MDIYSSPDDASVEKELSSELPLRAKVVGCLLI
jgi:hypothetical protein